MTIGAGAVVGMGSVVLNDVAGRLDRRRQPRPSALTAAAGEDRRMDAALERFSPATREWFAGAFAAPTAAQAGAWDAISSGKHALVVAPTGSGKTLSAFLWSLDRLATTPRAANPRHRTRVLYISPLKALGVDVERNLRSPLVGITQTAQAARAPRCPSSRWACARVTRRAATGGCCSASPPTS